MQVWHIPYHHHDFIESNDTSSEESEQSIEEEDSVMELSEETKSQ